MPFINSKVNIKTTKEQQEELKTRLRQAISIIHLWRSAWCEAGSYVHQVRGIIGLGLERKKFLIRGRMKRGNRHGTDQGIRQSMVFDV